MLTDLDSCAVGELSWCEPGTTKIKENKFWIDLLHKSLSTKINVTKATLFHKLDINIAADLAPHQIYDIDAMLQLETRSGVCYYTYPGHNMTRVTNIGVLSEPFGSGKTLIILGLIIYRQYPTPYIKYAVATNSRDGPDIIVQRKYKNILRPNIIFCGSSVAIQWENAVHKFTNLRCFLIISVHDIKALIRMIENYINKVNTKINDYDIIIVKNGLMTSKFKMQGYVEKKNTATKAYIFNVISNICKSYGCTFARLIIDDIDTISIPQNCGTIPSLFTWVVSGSTGIVPMEHPEIPKDFNLGQFLDYNDYNMSKIQSDLVWNIFNISCANKFTELCINCGKPTFYLYEFSNLNDGTISLIKILDADISEMLNGDAIETAAREAGITTSSVSEMFKKLLDKEYNLFDKLTKYQNYLEYIESNDLDDIDEIISLSDIQAMVKVRFNYRNLQTLVRSEIKINKVALEKASVKINRVKQNIAEGVCEICYSDLQLETCAISKCCGQVLCALCAFKCSRFGQCNEQFIGICSKCNTKINVNDSFIILGKNFDHTKISDLTYEVIEEPIIPEENIKVYNKIDVLMQIVQSNITYARRETNIEIENILRGTAILPEAPVKTIVVYAAYDETILDISTRFDAEGIKYKRLLGTANQKSNIVEQFNNKEIQVLLLKTSRDCAGLNLQSASDLVFMHKVIDSNIERQAVGRLLRYGRTTAATFHYLLYQNEKKEFKFIA